MDYSYLSLQDAVQSAQILGLNIDQVDYDDLIAQLSLVDVSPGVTVPDPLADLYIANKLFRRGIILPADLNYDDLATIAPEYYFQVAGLLYLPNQYNQGNVDRARRILGYLIVMTHQPPQTYIVGVPFNGQERYGDFNWMIRDPKYQDSLFIFNDVQDAFLAFINNVNNPPPGACNSGGGNSIIRPFQCANPPRAAGIPTGVPRQGYQNLETARPFIDRAIARIRQLVETQRYDRVFYSTEADEYTLGTAGLRVSPDVKNYIVTQLRSIFQ